MKRIRSITKINRKGISLIEVILAIGVVVIVLPALAILGNASLRTAKSSSRRSEAGKIASAGLEVVKYVKNAQGNGCGFSALNGSKKGTCYKYTTTNPQICGVLSPVAYKPGQCNRNNDNTWIKVSPLNSDNTYERQIFVQEDGNGNLVVRSKVRWEESKSGSGIKTVVMSTILTDR